MILNSKNKQKLEIHENIIKSKNSVGKKYGKIIKIDKNGPRNAEIMILAFFSSVIIVFSIFYSKAEHKFCWIHSII